MRRSVLRNAGRAALTVAAVAVSVVAFTALRTVIEAWSTGAAYAAKDRLTTRHRVSFATPLPRRYLDDIAAHVPGIRSVSYCDWFAGRWAVDPSLFFANLACADNAFEVYPEISVDPAALERWKHDKQGAIIGDMLAEMLHLRVGDRLTLQGSFYPGDWELTVDGIYTAPARSAVDRSSLFFRWDYKNERVPERQRDMIGWIFTRVDDASRSAEVSRAIDRLFAERDVQTTTMSERQANSALLGAVSAVLAALDVISLLVLGIMALVLGNSLAMGVRERTRELAVLRAIGFSPARVRGLVLAEALAIGWLGGSLGLALSLPLVQLGLGGWLEENMGKFFPVFRISPLTAATAQGATLLLAAVSALLPALRAGRVPVSAALQAVP